MREWVKDPIVYRFQYNDGLKGTMLLMNGLVGDFTFAAKLKGQSKPLSTLFYLPPNPNVTYSAALMAKAEETFVTGKAPYPVERTLLTSGLVEAGVQSLALLLQCRPPTIDLLAEASHRELVVGAAAAHETALEQRRHPTRYV